MSDQPILASQRFGLRKLSNWGRWGANDERGTANFITPAVIAQAGAEMKLGVPYRTEQRKECLFIEQLLRCVSAPERWQEELVHVATRTIMALETFMREDES